MTTKFDNYSEFKDAEASEKITLAHVSCFERLFNFTLDTGSIYYRVTDYVVTDVKRLGSDLVAVNNVVEVDDDTKFFFDINASRLYLFGTGINFGLDEIIVNYRLFFSNAPISLSWDLTDNGLQVEYIPRIQSTPSFKSKIGTDQKGISVTGEGTLVLWNQDEYFKGIYDRLVFEQKTVEIYSFHRDLLPSAAKLFYRGIITNKAYRTEDISLKVKDNLFKLDQRIPLTKYSASEVSEQFTSNYKRRLYGKLDDLLCRSIDQIKDGFTLTGVVLNGTIGSTTLTGVGTSFLDECSPNDEITILGQEFSIESIESDTSLTISDGDGFDVVFSSETVTNLPDRGWRKKNRTYLVADHAIREVSTDLTRMPQLNRIEVTDTTGFEANDIIDIGSKTGEILRVSGLNIVLKYNLDGIVALPATVSKRAVSGVFIEGKEIVLADLTTIDNVVGKCEITISNVSEFNITANKSLPSFASLTFTNGSRDITTVSDIDLTQYFQPRDWIRKVSASDSEFYEILAVSTQALELRVIFAEATVTEGAVYRLPTLVTDTSNVSCNVLGKTKDGTPSGDWIKTGAEITYDLLAETGLSNFINTTAFDTASQDAPYLMSLALPLNIGASSLPTIKAVVDIINQSIFGSLVINNDIDMAYNIMDVAILDTALPRITETDVIKWSLKSKSAQLVKTAETQYRFVDFDKSLKTNGSKDVSYTSPFVEDYETSDNTEDLELYVYEQNDAQELTERYVYYNSLSVAEVTIQASLNLSSLGMGDKVILNINDLYTRLGDSGTNLKIGTIISVDRTGETTKIIVSDLGNLYNRSSLIVDNASNVYASADGEERLITSYITHEYGLVDDDEDSINTNLIT